MSPNFSGDDLVGKSSRFPTLRGDPFWTFETIKSGYEASRGAE